ncbi:hypothetical protein LJA01_27890 [Lactobacillus japonicus]|nr:hypothetical protein LJA01_27890 [Lactobacillus japonicus]
MDIKEKEKGDLFMKLFIMGKNIELQLLSVRMVSLSVPILFQLNKGL